jgi:exopolyphosphatase / guanosine-5'-triphosphate,3'-diphosphate pyrophosphatase
MNRNDSSTELVDVLLHGSGLSLPDVDHGVRCGQFAATLFAGLAEPLALHPSKVNLAVAAALFHDVGYVRSHRDHHRKTYDILREANLAGIDDSEKLIVACAARYHGGPYPNIEHAGFGEMDADDQRVVRRIAAIVRVATALDASHLGLVERIAVGVDNAGAWLSAHTMREAPVESDRLREVEGSFHTLTQIPLRTSVMVVSE